MTLEVTLAGCSIEFASLFEYISALTLVSLSQLVSVSKTDCT